MRALFSIVLPIFALIGLGWAIRRRDILSVEAARDLNHFVAYFGLPALLFQIVATATWSDPDLPSFTATFVLASMGVFMLAIVIRRVQGVSLANSSIDGLNAGFANVGFIGIPLCAVAFGPSSLNPATIAAIFTSCVLYGLGQAVIEVGLNRAAGAAAVLHKVGISLLKNPILVAPFVGVLCAWLHAPIPEGVTRFTSLLASTASACALVSVGLFLADHKVKPQLSAIAPVLGLKLIGQPLLSACLARYAFHLSASATGVAIVLSALPTGTGPYLLSDLYDLDATTTSGSILLSTVVSVVTITLLLTFVNG
jgi:malonate transporter and related proteins